MKPSEKLTAAVIVLAAAVGVVLARPAPIVAPDQQQTRLNQAAPIPRGDVTIGQSFVAAQDGLTGVELLAVVYPDSSPPATLTLRLLDSAGVTLATASFAGGTIAHNSPLHLNFPPLPDSAGKTYRIRLEGTPDNQVTAWAYSLDGYASGTLLVNDAPAPGDLNFSTTFTYLWPDALRDTAAGLGRLATLALPLWLILFAPGLLLLDTVFAATWREYRAWARWGMALGFSLAVLPLAWLWITIVGMRWSAVTLGVAYVLVGLVWVWRGIPRLRTPRPSPHDLAMALILFVSLTARLLAVRDLAFPPWVDSPHHFTIARLLAESGRLPDDYLPLMPVDQFIYHYGFHALAVSAHWLTFLPLPDTFLFLGQVLNGLAPLATYAFVAGLTARPRTGLVAAFFVGLISLFPGYYLAWGRYTQLTGLLILAPALAAVWRVVAPGAPERPLRPDAITAVGLLAAGLLLTHYRLFFFFGTFVLVALAAGARGGWKRMLGAAALGAALSLPWLLRLGAQTVLPMLARPQVLAGSAGYNAFPVDYFRRELETVWIVAALLATGWGLLRRERALLVTAGWVAVTFALLNIGPGTWLVNNNAWAITLFLPGSLVLGRGADRWLAWANGATAGPGRTRIGAVLRAALRATRRPAALALLAGLAAWAGIRGLRAQVTMVNPVTVLATADDALALDWVEAHTPADALFLVNGWEWLNGIWAGSDGGAWLWPLIGRRSTIPPVDYSFQRDWRTEVNAFNQRAAQIEDASAPETLDLLRAAGVTHVFIGAKGGRLKPEMFANNPNYRLLYTNGGAWVFEIVWLPE